MKYKVISLVLALVLIFCFSCCTASIPEESGADSQSDSADTAADTSEYPTYEEIAAKNSLSELIKAGKRIIYSQLDMVGGSVCNIEYAFDADGHVYSYEKWNDIWCCCTDTFYLQYENDKITMHVSAQNVSPYVTDDMNFFDMNGEYEPTTRAADGSYISISRVAMDEEMVSTYASLWNSEVGDSLVSECTVDSETLAVKRVDFYIEHAKTGIKDYIAIAVIRTDGTEPVMPVFLRGVLEGATYTVTIQLSDGTVRNFGVPVGAVVVCETAEGEQLYSDSDRTVPYKFPDTPIDSDITVYCK